MNCNTAIISLKKTIAKTPQMSYNEFMTATIALGQLQATITDYHWTSASPEFSGLLNAMLDKTGPSGADPDPDLTAAKTAARQLHAHVIDHTPLDPPVDGRIY